MILGQLFYYEKKLEEVADLLAQKNYSQIEILGLDESDLKDLEKFTGSGQNKQLLTRFTAKYGSLLKEENLFQASYVWDLISDPFLKNSSSLLTTPGLQTIENWLSNSGSGNYQELFDEVGIVTEIDDVAVVYGLKVIDLLLNSSQNKSKNAFANLNEKQINLDEKSKIVVICTPNISPLFTHLNCTFIDIGLTDSEVVTQLKTVYTNNPEIDLVLIDSPKLSELKKLINKHIIHDFLIAPIDLDVQSSSGFFDQLVKDTLGVRLVD
jgi:hypothetical protein